MNWYIDPEDEDIPTEAVHNSVSFEAKQIGMTKDKNGFVLKLSVHPDDVPDEIMRDWVGSHYMVAMVKLDDDGKPVKTKKTQAKEEADKVVRMAGMLCRNEKFWAYMSGIFDTEIKNEEEAVEELRDFLGIGSRKELAENQGARSDFLKIVQGFEEHRR
jgi:hypothetical protein